MLKKYFIPLMIGLLFIAVVIYYVGTGSHRPRDMKSAVPVERYTLRNGMALVVMPNDRIPVVTYRLLVRAGAADDPQGKTGLAHYLEHLMFTGTKLYPEGMYERTISRLGGVQNAHTSRDATVYEATVPAEALDLAFAMEADRLAHLDISGERAARELKIITEERGLRIENNPAAQWSEQLAALTFLNHPYGQPVIGWAEDMASLTAADAAAFFDRYYRPGNMVLVVAGDVRPRDVRRLAERYFGVLVAGEPVPRQWPSEPPARLKRLGEMRDARVSEPRLLVQFAAPSVRVGETAQAIPLAVFAQYLGGGDASALYNMLVREQKLATSVFASYDMMAMGPGLFRITAIPAPGVTLPTLEQGIARALETILASPLEGQAVARAKTLLSAEVIFAQDGLQAVTDVMAELYATGLDEQFFYEWAASIEKVTPDQVLEAARAVIVTRRSVTGYLLPEAEGTHAP